MEAKLHREREGGVMKIVLLAAPILLIGMQAMVLADTVLPGTEIQIRTDRPIDVSRWERGRIYPAHVERDIRARDGDIAIPRGSQAEVIVRRTGQDMYTLDLESITVNGNRYAMDTTGPQYNMSQDNYGSGNGLLGGIIGAIAGANGERVEPSGGEIRVPAGSVIRFQLQQPLHTVGWRDPGYDNGGQHYHHDNDWYR
jgi:hypothetical protein